MNKTKIIPGFGLAIGALIWLFTHLSAPTQQILAYVGVGLVFAVVMWGMWKFRATPERKPESSDYRANKKGATPPTPAHDWHVAEGQQRLIGRAPEAR